MASCRIQESELVKLLIIRGADVIKERFHPMTDFWLVPLKLRVLKSVQRRGQYHFVSK